MPLFEVPFLFFHYLTNNEKQTHIKPFFSYAVTQTFKLLLSHLLDQRLLTISTQQNFFISGVDGSRNFEHCLQNCPAPSKIFQNCQHMSVQYSKSRSHADLNDTEKFILLRKDFLCKFKFFIDFFNTPSSGGN